MYLNYTKKDEEKKMNMTNRGFLWTKSTIYQVS